MKYNLTLLKNTGRLLTAAITYLIAFSTILTIYEKEIVKPVFLLGIPFILICYLVIEQYCYHPLLYIFLHGLFFLPIWMVPFPTVCYKYLYLTLLILENIHGILIWKRSKEKPYEEAPWALFLVITVIYIITLAYHLTTLSQLIYVCGIALLLLHFIRLSLEGLSKTLSKSSHAASVPVKKIVLTHSFLIGFIAIAFLITAVFVYVFRLDRAAYYIGEYIVKLTQVIIYFFFYLIGLLRALFFIESRVEQTDTMDSELQSALEAVREPSLLGRVLDGICSIIALLFILYLFYRAITYLARLFLNRYAKDTDIVVALQEAPEKVTRKKETKNVLEQMKAFFRPDNAAKIRRAYRLKIKGYNQEIYRKNYTPEDIASKVLQVYDEDISELTNVYEKARYSNEEITFEDVKKGGVL